MKTRRKKRQINKKPHQKSQTQNDDCNNSENTDSTQNSSSSNQKTSKLCCFSSTDYIVLASTVAIALGEELTETDLNILSTFFAVLSDELALIASVRGCTSNDTAVFVPPVPDVALTSSSNKNIHTKKIVKKKLKKK